MKRFTAVAFALLCLTAASARAETPPPNAIPTSNEQLWRAAGESLVRTHPAFRKVAFEVDVLNEMTVYWSKSVPDLDGDKVDDIVSERWDLEVNTTGLFFYSGTFAYKVIGGANGKVMWEGSETFVDGFADVEPMRVGEKGANGLYSWTVEASNAAWTAKLKGLNGDGTAEWTTVFPSAYTWRTPVVGGVGVPLVVLPMDSLEGPAQDILVTQADYVAAPDAAAIETRSVMFDGATGNSTPYGLPLTSTEMAPLPQPGGDLDADGLIDVVIYGNGPDDDGYMQALKGTDATEIWRTEADLKGWWWGEAMPDMTDDGRSDLILGFYKDDKHSFRIVDGQSGHPVWEAKGYFPRIAGDIDGDQQPDIAAFDAYFSKDALGDKFLAYDNAGAPLYEVVHWVDSSKCTDICISSGYLLNAGDLDSDGIGDIYTMRWVVDDLERFIATGRTGEKIFEHQRFIPVHGSLDGRGDDMVSLKKRGGGNFSLIARRGGDARPLWSSNVQIDGAQRLGDIFQPHNTAMPLNDDGCDDLLLSFRGAGDVTLVALDGRDGSLMWSTPMVGNATPKVTTRDLSRASC
jgi:hypothetical protein